MSSTNQSESSWVSSLPYVPPARLAILFAHARCSSRSSPLCRNHLRGAGTPHRANISPDMGWTSRMSRARDRDVFERWLKNTSSSDAEQRGRTVVSAMRHHWEYPMRCLYHLCRCHACRCSGDGDAEGRQHRRIEHWGDRCRLLVARERGKGAMLRELKEVGVPGREE